MLKIQPFSPGNDEQYAARRIRMPRESLIAVLCALVLTSCGADNAPPTSVDGETIVLPVPHEATEATRIANEAFGAKLPLSDQSDFVDAKRGFLASIDGGVIRDDDGNIVWDQERYGFLQGQAPATVNPSLWRQAELNTIHGLFEVVDGIYQLRGYDLAVMTVVRGETGWILIDPLMTRETSAASLKLLQETLGQRPVSAVLITHTHGDHFGGIRGVVSEEDFEAGRVRIIAPEGFTEHTVSENVIAGIAMSRRAGLQFGNNLPAGPTGQVDSGIGKALSSGVVGFMQPTESIAETGQVLTVDGIEFEFISAPNTEAPAEFMFYMPQFRALHVAELATATLHNVLTLRGAQVRDALAWSKRIDDALAMFGNKSDVVLASHNWPTWGADNVKTYLENQRDTYRFIHDQTMRLANAGYTMHEIAAEIGEPAFMQEDFSTRGYYGTVNHNSKATYQRYFGWWDGNPANLNPHPPEEQAKRYVALAGGADAMIKNADKAYKEGDYRWTATLMNHLVFADPKNKTARAFLAGAYEQLGYQSESSIWRNYYLAAAIELREDFERPNQVRIANRDFVKAIPTADYFDALAVRVNPEKAKRDHIVNFTFTDTNEIFGVRIAGGVTSHRVDGHYDDASIGVRLKRSDLDEITLGEATFQGKLARGAIRVDGNPLAFVQFLRSHDQLEPWFDVVTP